MAELSKRSVERCLVFCNANQGKTPSECLHDADGEVGIILHLWGKDSPHILHVCIVTMDECEGANQ
jgi:hypothetical protein